jgi:EAL domain-containing protein (putative c-di-GMP-specific phosphodiesterase class I)
MASFVVSDVKNRTGKISLNLNLSTIDTPDFMNFEQYIKGQGQSIIVEVQPIDMLNNMRTFINVKEKLHKLGHEVLLDATSLEMLQSLNIKSLGFDYVKLFWHDFMEEYNPQTEKIKKMFDEIGVNKIILAKCLSENAVRWGIKNGIRSFQGPYIDMLEVAMIRKLCPNGKRCTAADCLKRKKMISGYHRNMCEYKEILDRNLG